MCVLAGTALAGPTTLTVTTYTTASCTGTVAGTLTAELDVCKEGSKLTSCSSSSAVLMQYAAKNCTGTGNQVTMNLGCSTNNGYGMQAVCSSASAATLSMFALLATLFVSML
jgi:hypothetical protein